MHFPNAPPPLSATPDDLRGDGEEGPPKKHREIRRRHEEASWKKKKGIQKKVYRGQKLVQRQAQIFVQKKLAWSVLIDFAGRKRGKNKVADVGGIGNAVFSRPSGNGRCTLEGERRQKSHRRRRRMHA